MDIERHTNNRPLTYIGSDGEEDQVLTPNLVMWGQDAYILEDMEVEEDKLTRFRSTDDCKIPNKVHGIVGRRNTFEASWKVIESSDSTRRHQKSEKSCSTWEKRKTEDAGRRAR